LNLKDFLVYPQSRGGLPIYNPFFTSMYSGSCGTIPKNEEQKN
jgi:hypothetical protein